MRKFLVSLFLLSSILFAQNISLKDALKEAKATNKDVLLFIYSDYCYYCENMLKNTLEDKEVVSFINERFVFIKINHNRTDLLRKDIKTNFTPITYIISGEDGEILLELPGRKDKKTFISIVKDTLLE